LIFFLDLFFLGPLFFLEDDDDNFLDEDFFLLLNCKKGSVYISSYLLRGINFSDEGDVFFLDFFFGLAHSFKYPQGGFEQHNDIIYIYIYYE
jgi:hypothetical protein